MVACEEPQTKTEVDVLIEALPEVSALTILHRNYITEIRTKIDLLDEEDLQKVLSLNLNRFIECEVKMEELIVQETNKSYAINITNLIQSLPSVDLLTLEDAKTIHAITENLNLMEDAYSSLIDASLLTKYQEALVAINALNSDYDQANTVNILLLELPTLDELTLEMQNLVVSIRDAYDQLTSSQKAFVDVKIALLESYEERLIELSETNLEEQEELAFADLEQLLFVLDNQEVISDVELPVEFKWGSVTFNIIWSSNSQAISDSGIVKRGLLNTNVLLLASVNGQTIQKTIEIDMVVRGTRVVDMPAINPNKKLTFAYFRNPAYGTNLMERDYMKIDVLNYSFGNIIGGELSVYNLSNLNNVLKIREKGVRVVIVIDGVSEATSDAFALASSTQENRIKLANSIASVLEQYQFDGVDLDWEFPSGTTEKNNFSLLVKEIRIALDRSSRDLILSAAVVSGSYSTHYDLVELNKYLDYLHIMTYGMSGSYVAKHQSALIKSTYAPYAVASSVDMYAKGGIDITKIVFGIPFYVKIGNVANSPTNVLGAALTSPISVSYTTFMRDYYNKNGMVEYYDEEAKVFYSYSGNKFASYDNPLSIQYKCEYAIANNLAGVMFWDYGHDQVGGTLLDAIYQQFKLDE